MGSLLIKNAELLACMDDAQSEIHGGGVFIRDGFIEQVGESRELPVTADEVVDLHGHILLPGLVNCHHHFYQTLTRAVPAAQDANLFHWLKTLYPIWARLTPEAIFTSTQTALAELALSGCTTAADHLYLFPNGSRLDDEIEAAKEIGLRLQASRGSMSLGESQGGLPPDSVVETEEAILKDSQRLIQKYQDPKPGSFIQVVLAPCSPFSVSSDLMKQSARLAREYHVHLHTHLAETEDEQDFCLAKFGYKPVDYMKSVDWMGADVWFAHAVHVDAHGIEMFAQYGCGVAHCPTSNMRLASGIAPIREYRQAGVKVGLGVDGSASNDGSHLLAEARQAMLVSRLREGLSGFSRSDDPNRKLMTARQSLWLATRGGAAVLGRKDIGSLEVGKCADLIAFKSDRLEFSGALYDPLAALVFAQPVNVDLNMVGGSWVVKDGQLVTSDSQQLVDKHNRIAQRMVEAE